MINDNYSLIRAVAACPQVRTADIDTNVTNISETCHRLERECKPSIMVFPELSLSGYTCEEMFNQEILYENVESGLERLLQLTSDCESLIAVGLPFVYNSRRYNTAALIRKGKLLGIVPKTYLPNNNEFYEARYFESATRLGKELVDIEYAGQKCKFGVFQLFDMGKACIGVEIGRAHV